MGTLQYVSKWGSSLAVRIPKAVAEQCQIIEGSSVQLETCSDGIIIRKRTYDLATMVDQITSDNIHDEQDFGVPLGKETW